MSNKSRATAKDAEGKLESAYGEMTGDMGHQIRGKAKQVQSSAMGATEELKEGAKAVKKKLSDTADHVSDKLS
ncbi:CsbD family protein [Cyanobium sp. Alchichica 3B3-8F6]|uniref:CsbD family protein n=1 Tax=Cyanobium sp. Alchichica 3B3-8F6 TaxID=2823696 RepID=UPI0020CC2588|nr:CsbD family protein [Cyanobium sp. Alchichica 3B3-8F6]MCP9882025.1 CsbD family protein [Cyanobium sp. Alchichica 3B3-8F6]